ncbi:MAG: hypothetical protein JXR94_06900, partial [Candidatus Hydrogenedentes bacterium]|nr:hypothetical protein [Candidatus Hydrogenedentota bacterium]
MKYNLSDFVVGLVHVFVIFMPGGILLAALAYAFDIEPILGLAGQDAGPAEWFLALAACYVLGHLVSLMASGIEDTLGVPEGEVRAVLRVLAGQSLRAQLPDILIEEKRERRWCCTVLRKNESTACRGVEQHDADRRFFRNVRVVFGLSAVVFGARALMSLLNGPGDPAALACAMAGVALMCLAHWRYRYQDRKFTQLAFESMVAEFPPAESAPFASTELRWFGRGSPPEGLDKLFRDVPAPAEWRCDYYVAGTGEEVGIKWREGTLEIKRRMGIVRTDDASLEGLGTAERWEKRSYGPREEPDPDGPPGGLTWIPVCKSRRQLKFRCGAGGAVERLADPDERVPGAGCCVELTRLRAGLGQDVEFWTFAFEAFGDGSEQLAALKRAAYAVREDIGDEALAALKACDACGYAARLKKGLKGAG